LNTYININSWLNCCFLKIPYFFLKAGFQKFFENWGKDCSQGSSSWFWKTKHVKSSTESKSQNSSTSWWWCSTSNESSSINWFPIPLSSLIHSLSINKKSKKFNRWLSTIVFNSWHVNIINKYSNLFTTWRSKGRSACFLKLFFNTLLSSNWRCLGRHIDVNWYKVIFLFHQG